jgi:hypothetical protein
MSSELRRLRKVRRRHEPGVCKRGTRAFSGQLASDDLPYAMWTQMKKLTKEVENGSGGLVHVTSA